MCIYFIRKPLPHAPNYPREPPLQPVCTRYEKCQGCPYPRHGFLCWGPDDECLRDAVREIEERERSK